MADHKDLLADRLNVEPAIFKGCSSSELALIVGISVLLWLPLSLFIAWLFGAITLGFGMAGVGVVATVLVCATLFQRIKRNRPEGYYQQQWRLRCYELGLCQSPWIRRSGAWDIGRTGRAPLSPRD